MTFITYFCENKKVEGLLREFEVSQVPLFHYTDRDASNGITGGELWMARADHFLDSEEIRHGLSVLRKAGQEVLDGQERASFDDILGALRERLESCFVLSLSKDPASEHLRNLYAPGPDGVVLEFIRSFAMQLRGTGWHPNPDGPDSGRDRFAIDRYDVFEGLVKYDNLDQQRIAVMACRAYRDLRSTDAHLVDGYHFIAILMRCIVLFKTQEFEKEEEYRIALVRKPNVAKRFECKSIRHGKPWVYIKVRIPLPYAARISVKAQ